MEGGREGGRGGGGGAGREQGDGGERGNKEVREGGREHGKGGRSGGGIERGMEQGRVIQGRYPEEDTGQYTVYSQTIPQRGPFH